MLPLWLVGARLAAPSQCGQGKPCPYKGSKLALVALVALGFLLIPTSRLEALPSLCLFRNLLGMDCPGCGMIRAISCAFHGEFLRAWHFNRGIAVVLPLLVSAGLRKQ